MHAADGAPRGAVDVLVACADEDARRIVGAMLTHAGWRVCEMADATAVLDRARAERPRLVVTSYPTAAGERCTITEVLRGDPDTTAIPILNVTSRAFPADLAEAASMGVALSLVMPVPPLAVADAVARLVGPPPGAGGRGTDECR